jgi:uncharacterized protein (TIGR02217 family)
VAGFHEIQFPTEISLGATFGPEFDTDIAKIGTAGEQRNINRQYPLHKGDVAHGVKSEKDFEDIRAFFYCRYGKAYGFRYKDWSDYTAKNQAIGTGDGATTQFQLVKKYTDSGGYSLTRTIKKPVENSVKVYVAGTLSTGWTVSSTNGIVTFSTSAIPSSGAAITADFYFDVPCRLDTDYMPVNYEAINAFSWDNIPIVELQVKSTS